MVMKYFLTETDANNVAQDSEIPCGSAGREGAEDVPIWGMQRYFKDIQEKAGQGFQAQCRGRKDA